MRMPAAIFAVFAIIILSTMMAATWSGPAHEDGGTPQVATSKPAASSSSASAPVAVPEASAKAMSYYWSRIRYIVADFLLGLAFCAVLLWTGFSARMRNCATRIGRKWFFILVAYFVLYTILSFAAALPLSYLRDFANEHAFGLSQQSLGAWFDDKLKALAVGLAVGALFIWIPFLLLAKSPKRWWFYTSLAAVPYMCLMMLVQPIWIAPLFNKFGPMHDAALEKRITALADRAGIEGSRIFEVDMSRKTNRVNAYVTGIGDSKRIVLWDTLTSKLERPEVLFVMGHEMGHYVLGHIWKTIALVSGSVLALLFGVDRIGRVLLARYRMRFGFERLDDVAALPLIMLVANILAFAMMPALTAASRMQEAEADRFGLELTQNNRACATAFIKLQTENLANPRPHWLFHWWTGTHPSLAERIDFCNRYRPWNTGDVLAYGDRMRPAPTAHGAAGASR
jgi:Zn-dependent protease with chaperone function